MVRPERQGIVLIASGDSLAASTARITVPGVSLVNADDRFVRGDGLHLSFSGSPDEPLGIDLTLTAIEADPQRLVLESVISLRTSSLDSHPAVELQFGVGDPAQPRWDDAAWDWLDPTDAALWLQAHPEPPAQGGVAQAAVVTTAVLCGERDRSSLDRPLVSDAGRLRFFGDFLEKGVIRKVQPWWVWSRAPLGAEAACEIAGKLAARPLPLAD